MLNITEIVGLQILDDDIMERFINKGKIDCDPYLYITIAEKFTIRINIEDYKIIQDIFHTETCVLEYKDQYVVIKNFSNDKVFIFEVDKCKSEKYTQYEYNRDAEINPVYMCMYNDVDSIPTYVNYLGLNILSDGWNLDRAIKLHNMILNHINRYSDTKLTIVRKQRVNAVTVDIT